MVKQQQQHHHHVIIEKIWKSMREKDEKRNHRFCKGSLVWTVCLCVRVVCCMFMYSYVKIDNVTFMMTFCHSFAQIIWYSVLVLIKLSQMWFAHGLWVIRNSRWSITIIWIIGYVSFIFHFSLSSNPRFIEKKNRFCNWLDSPLTSFMLWCCMPSIRIRYTHSLQCHFFWSVVVGVLYFSCVRLHWYYYSDHRILYMESTNSTFTELSNDPMRPAYIAASYMYINVYT